MKKTLLFLFLLFSLLALSACGGPAVSETIGQTASSTASSGLPAAGSAASGTGSPNGQFEGDSRLAIGTILLDGTENEITQEQAAELLLLWQAVQSLSSSDTAAVQEIQGLYDQIDETLTDAQRQAIAEMDMSRESMNETFQALGIDLGAGAGRFGDLTEEQRATMEAARASGQMPEGGFGGGPGFGGGGGQGMAGGGPPGGVPGGGFQGGEINPEMQATLEARRDSGQTGMRVPPFLIQAVIQYLEGQAG